MNSVLGPRSGTVMFWHHHIIMECTRYTRTRFLWQKDAIFLHKRGISWIVYRVWLVQWVLFCCQNLSFMILKNKYVQKNSDFWCRGIITIIVINILCKIKTNLFSFQLPTLQPCWLCNNVNIGEWNTINTQLSLLSSILHHV